MARGPGSIGWTCYVDGVSIGSGPSSVFASIVNLSVRGPSYCQLSAPSTITRNGIVYYFSTWALPASAIEVGLNDGKTGFQMSEMYSDDDGKHSVARVYYVSNKPSPTQKYLVVVASNYPDRTNVSGGGYYDAGQSCTITTSIVDQYKKQLRFLYWKSSEGNIVYTKSHSFSIVKDISWMAVHEEIPRTGLILYDPETNPVKILYSQTKNKILRDE